MLDTYISQAAWIH